MIGVIISVRKGGTSSTNGFIPWSGGNSLTGSILSTQKDAYHNFGHANALVRTFASDGFNTSDLIVSDPLNGGSAQVVAVAGVNGSVQISASNSGGGPANRFITITSANKFIVSGADAEYAFDYSANYSDRSLIDKAFSFSSRRQLSALDAPVVTGILTEQINRALLLSAGYVQAGQILELSIRIAKTAGLGNTTIRVYTNESLSLTGAKLLATAEISNITTAFIERTAEIKLVNSTAVITPTDPTVSDKFASTPLSLVTTNWAVEQYIIISIQNSLVSDSSYTSSFLIKKY